MTTQHSWKNNIERELSIKRGLGQFPDLGGLGKKKGGWYPNAHYVRDLVNFNEIFGKNVTYDDIKSY